MEAEVVFANDYSDIMSEEEEAMVCIEVPPTGSSKFNTSASTVNHPSHYNLGKIEVIDYIEDQDLGFCLGNAIKYISRAGKKNPDKEIEDLEKAIWYIQRRIKEVGQK